MSLVRVARVERLTEMMLCRAGAVRELRAGEATTAKTRDAAAAAARDAELERSSEDRSFKPWEMVACGEDYEDEELRELAMEMTTDRELARADNTTTKNLSYWRRWVLWAESKGLTPLPASPTHVALWLTMLKKKARNEKKTCAAVLSGSAAVSWAHDSVGMESPTLHADVARVREVAKRQLGTGKGPKLAMPSAKMIEVVELLGAEGADVHDLMTLAAMVLQFAGFLRADEVLTLQADMVEFTATYVRVFLQKSKTDQYRAGRWVEIAYVPGRAYCPGKILRRLQEMMGEDAKTEGPIFRASQRLKGGKYVLRKKAMSYGTLLKREKDAAERVGMDPELIGTHSLRAGGATANANQGVEDRLWKKHGNWKSEWVADRYARERVRERLKPSRAVWEDIDEKGESLP